MVLKPAVPPVAQPQPADDMPMAAVRSPSSVTTPRTKAAELARAAAAKAPAALRMCAFARLFLYVCMSVLLTRKSRPGSHVRADSPTSVGLSDTDLELSGVDAAPAVRRLGSQPSSQIAPRIVSAPTKPLPAKPSPRELSLGDDLSLDDDDLDVSEHHDSELNL